MTNDTNIEPKEEAAAAEGANTEAANNETTVAGGEGTETGEATKTEGETVEGDAGGDEPQAA